MLWGRSRDPAKLAYFCGASSVCEFVSLRVCEFKPECGCRASSRGWSLELRVLPPAPSCLDRSGQCLTRRRPRALRNRAADRLGSKEPPDVTSSVRAAPPGAGARYVKEQSERAAPSRLRVGDSDLPSFHITRSANASNHSSNSSNSSGKKRSQIWNFRFQTATRGE